MLKHQPCCRAILAESRTRKSFTKKRGAVLFALQRSGRASRGSSHPVGMGRTGQPVLVPWARQLLALLCTTPCRAVPRCTMPCHAMLCPTGQGVPVPTGAAVPVVPRRGEAGAGGREVPRGDGWSARRDQIKRLLGEMRGVLTGHLNISPALSERQRKEIAFFLKKKRCQGRL